MERIFEKLNRYFEGNWHLAVLDLKIGRWVVEPKISYIAYLKAQNAHGRHILIQPDSMAQPYYLLIDDLSVWQLRRQHRSETYKPGRMVVQTSKGNYQVWIRSSRPLSLEEKRHWLKRFRSDPGADPNNRWGRCPGFRNHKHKHRQADGSYPLSRLIWIDWKRQAHVPVTDIHPQDRKSKPFSTQHPGGGSRRLKKITRLDYERGDESVTDFAYAMALLRRGFTDQFVRDRIMSERRQWNNHTGEKRLQAYLNRTIEQAKKMMDRR